MICSKCFAANVLQELSTSQLMQIILCEFVTLKLVSNSHLQEVWTGLQYYFGLTLKQCLPFDVLLRFTLKWVHETEPSTQFNLLICFYFSKHWKENLCNFSYGLVYFETQRSGIHARLPVNIWTLFLSVKNIYTQWQLFKWRKTQDRQTCQTGPWIQNTGLGPTIQCQVHAVTVVNHQAYPGKKSQLSES